METVEKADQDLTSVSLLTSLGAPMGRSRSTVPKSECTRERTPKRSSPKATAYAKPSRKVAHLVIVATLLDFSREKQNAPAAFVTPFGFAVLYARLGDRDNAFAWLDRAL